jgi:hypothetical protein
MSQTGTASCRTSTAGQAEFMKRVEVGRKAYTYNAGTEQLIIPYSHISFIDEVEQTPHAYMATMSYCTHAVQCTEYEARAYDSSIRSGGGFFSYQSGRPNKHDVIRKCVSDVRLAGFPKSAPAVGVKEANE